MGGKGGSFKGREREKEMQRDTQREERGRLRAGEDQTGVAFRIK